MELEQFIHNSMVQIIKGIMSAQKRVGSPRVLDTG